MCCSEKRKRGRRGEKKKVECERDENLKLYLSLFHMLSYRSLAILALMSMELASGGELLQSAVLV